jgi:dihydropteroate synthase
MRSPIIFYNNTLSPLYPLCYNNSAMEEAEKLSRISLKEWQEEHSKNSSGVTRCGKTVFTWGQKTLVMGIINVSPDSFSGDGLDSPDKAVQQAQRFIDAGADMLDIGGESTRPGSQPTDADIDLEMKRVIPVIEKLAVRIDIPISVDTYHIKVARRALEAGADIINDIWGLSFEPGLAKLVAERKTPIILMSNQRNREVKNIVPAVIADLKRAIDVALDAGILWDNIIIDPGIGFGKTLEQNLELVRRLHELTALGRPILLGVSRKSMIGLTLNLPVEQRLEGTAAVNAIGISMGADIIRVHDVPEMIRVSRMCDAIIRKR